MTRKQIENFERSGWKYSSNGLQQRANELNNEHWWELRSQSNEVDMMKGFVSAMQVLIELGVKLTSQQANQEAAYEKKLA